MPRAKKLRADLEEHGVMLNEYGIEIGRLTVNGILVLNLSEVFFEIERWAVTHSGRCSINHLNRVFSRSGSWGFDPAVSGAVNELVSLRVIDQIEDYVVPRLSAHAAINKIPGYTTQTETHAGLELIDE